MIYQSHLTVKRKLFWKTVVLQRCHEDLCEVIIRTLPGTDDDETESTLLQFLFVIAS
jgi:hypothetical protein